MFTDLRTLSQHILEIKNQSFQRYLLKEKKLFSQRLSLLIGQRGVGKTTTLIQYLLAQVNFDPTSKQILYIPADHFLMGTTSLYEVAEEFNNHGGTLIAFDEIHKYSNWSQELKSIYDTFPNLKVIASGSSALEIHKGTHDLSRRALIYRLNGMSFREYLELYYGLTFPVVTLEEIIKNHEKITFNILKTITKVEKKVLTLFSDYLVFGYYPFYYEINDPQIYALLVEQNIHTTIESDLVSIYPNLTGVSVKKIKQSLSYISQAVPFTPNWQKIRSLVDIGDERTLKTYFKYLEDAGIIQMVLKASKKLHAIETPEKIYINNSNQMVALSLNPLNHGTIRETFFLNIVSMKHKVRLPMQGDFLVDNDFLFEIGGKKKGFEQIKQQKNAFLACDEIEGGFGSKIPLWLFGFLY